MLLLPDPGRPGASSVLRPFASPARQADRHSTCRRLNIYRWRQKRAVYKRLYRRLAEPSIVMPTSPNPGAGSSRQIQTPPSRVRRTNTATRNPFWLIRGKQHLTMSFFASHSKHHAHGLQLLIFVRLPGDCTCRCLFNPGALRNVVR